jgi:K+-sensing histidine kinase KdpD
MAHNGPRPAQSRGPLPRAHSGLPTARRRGGLLLAALALPTLTAVLVMLRGTLALASVLLLYLLLVVAVALIGGTVPALLAAVASFLLANWYLTPPYHTFVVEQRDQLIALAVFVVVAIIVSVTVELAARQRVTAERSRIEAEVLARFTGAPVSDTSLATVLEQVRTVFGMTSVALLERHGEREEPAEVVGPRLSGVPAISVDAGPSLRLVAEGPELFGEDRRLLARLAAAAAHAWESQRLADSAARGRQLAEIDRLRSGLLAAVGHDLRTPLAGIKAAVSSLRQEDVAWTPEEEQELLASIEASADRLEDLIANRHSSVPPVTVSTSTFLMTCPSSRPTPVCWSGWSRISWRTPAVTHQKDNRSQSGPTPTTASCGCRCRTKGRVFRSSSGSGSSSLFNGSETGPRTGQVSASDLPSPAASPRRWAAP